MSHVARRRAFALAIALCGAAALLAAWPLLAPVRPTAQGVTRRDSARSQPGYNLFDAAHDGTAYLLDMDGRIVHRWDYSTAAPGGPTREPTTARWIATGMLDDGSLLLVHDGHLAMRLSWDSRPLEWAALAAHHALARAADGTYFTFARQTSTDGARFSQLVQLDARFRPVAQRNAQDWRDALPNDALEQHLAGRGPAPEVPEEHGSLDYYHENGVFPVAPRAGEGRVLVCLRNVHRIAMLDDAFMPIWSWGAGELEHPHDPSQLDNGHVLVFDNGTRRGRSRAVEYDPGGQRIVWQYPNDGDPPIYTEMGGAAQRLDNGNTLLTISDEGRVIEVTPAGEIVWEFLHPQLQMIGWPLGSWQRTPILRMVRYPAATVDRLLAARQPHLGPPPAWWPQ